MSWPRLKGASGYALAELAMCLYFGDIKLTKGHRLQGENSVEIKLTGSREPGHGKALSTGWRRG